jgi:ferric-dicitrate binding protein FerR (iron transport regulator)
MNTSNNEPGLEELLREVGPRGSPSAQTKSDVHAAVHAEWQTVVAKRRKRHRIMGWSVAAGLTAMAVAVGLGLQFMGSPAQPVAMVAKVDGQFQAQADRVWDVRTAGDTIMAGQSVRTDGHSHAALALGKQLSLRLDSNTVVEVLAANRVALKSGALYVDSLGQPGDDPLSIETSAGTVRHVGTQYQVRTQGDGIDVSVREGRVAISHSGGSTTGNAGEKIHVTPAGDIARTSLSSRDSEWSWTTSTATAFDIENQPLAFFLKWVARETGRRLVYATPLAQSAAEELKLKGSTAGLDPDAALAAVLATTHLRRTGADDTLLEISLDSATDSAGSPRPTP